MKKLVLAAFCTVALVSYVVADEFGAVIMKVDGKTVTYFKTKPFEKGKGKGGFGKAEKEGDQQKGTVSSSVKVSKGVFDKDAGGIKLEALEGGLTNEMFKTIDQEKGVNVTITTSDSGADKGQITSIVTKGFGGKGKKKGG